MTETPDDIVLSLRDVKKTFGPIVAIKQMQLDVRRGRVHTLLGENGAGKSTLMKILAGVQPATEGTILLDGTPFAPKSPQEAAKHGLAIVFQELSLVNTLTVAENILANREPNRFGFISDRKLIERAETLVRELGLPIDVRARVGDLSIAQRQLVEIAKGLSHDAQIVILDEPTSSLSDAEAEILFKIIGRLTEAGKAVIYISHRMEEIMRLSDDITVMRDGAYVATLEKNETSIDALIALMVGRQMNEIYPPRIGEEPGDDVAPVLEVEHLSSGRAFVDVSFSVRPGEILGFFGLVGAGRSDVMKALFGMRWYEGTIRLDGKEVDLKDPSEAIRHGIGFVTENRKEEGLVLAHSLRNNITMAALGGVSSGGFLSRHRERQRAEEESTRLGVRTASIETIAGTLSGGNQQKVVLAKWLMTRPRVLILDEPTRGVDVGAKFEIYRIIRQLAAEGTAIIMVSSELPEVLGMSSRVAIMSRKHLQAIAPRADLTPERVMSFATGQNK
ncbi:monosaccharide ABC transporter ATP-binding protein (CUT2 family) [Breoghania corrubedonensis]|uniref:Monosaccharide ABC transporter ATP-binding protein (CUT2 family) n=1 Tax=Breoghania corrubedonensis TaxID=665038 RepID=A0A2T5VA30_9HYPH|nr:sugar ABC transporter ATP-binding protein [Breoghania corrubedonensis]PTW60609.1 monosaccharide ABC transporter ATP-binding protein (CUT2 family) [Breoghania corrubedonensis]